MENHEIFEKNKKISKTRIASLSIFFVMFFITAIMGVYRSALNDEVGFFKAELSREAHASTVVLDISRQGLPKKIFQAEAVSVSSGHRGGLVNATGRELKVQVCLQRFNVPAEMEYLDPDFDPVTGILNRPLQPGESFSVGVDLFIPKTSLNNRRVAAGTLLFLDRETQEPLASVRILILNREAGLKV